MRHFENSEKGDEMMANYTFYDAVEGETHNGRRVYEFTRPCYTVVDRHEVDLTGVRFTLSAQRYPWGYEQIATVIPGSYELLKPRIGEWHWDHWVFDGGSDIEFGMEYIEAGCMGPEHHASGFELANHE